MLDCTYYLCSSSVAAEQRQLHLLWVSAPIDQIRERGTVPTSSSGKEGSRAIERSPTPHQQLQSLTYIHGTSISKTVIVCHTLRWLPRVEFNAHMCGNKRPKFIKGRKHRRGTDSMIQIHVGWLNTHPTFPSTCMVSSVGRRFI